MLTPAEFAQLKRLGAELFHARRHKRRAVQRATARIDPLIPNAWVLQGSGHYGEAWSHSAFPDHVVKLSGPASWGNVRHIHNTAYSMYALDAWPVFARHCMAHPHAHLPAILHFEQVSQGMAWAIMPRYTACPWQVSANFRDEVEAGLTGSKDSADWLWPLAQMVDALEFNADIHAGNVMLDPRSGAMVLTDPFST